MHRILAGDVSLHVQERGTGRPLLLVHGFPLDLTMWRSQVEELSREFRVITPVLGGGVFVDPHELRRQVKKIDPITPVRSAAERRGL